MRICVAQLEPIAADIEANIRKHHALLDLAARNDADMVCFPELSLTGYEPTLAKHLAISRDDLRLSAFQEVADSKPMWIAVGMPTAAERGVLISMLVFQPGKPPTGYHKQELHADELPYFVRGDQQVILDIATHAVAPAICYESLQDSHAERAAKLGADIYLASVAKSAQGMEMATLHYSVVAKRYAMKVLVANAIGPCDRFVGAGQSAVWSNRGELLIQLDEEREGIALLDPATDAVSAAYL